MKKITTLLFASAAAFVVFASMSKSSNGRSNSTGSSGEGTCTNCHGSANANGSVLMRSNIPAAGYTAGTTYQMKVVVKYAGRSTWGFDVEALNSSNSNIGTLAVTDGTYTKQVNSTRTNIEHRMPGATADSMVYNFNWTAPATGSGTATFYYSALAANGNGNNDNSDYTYTSSTSFSEYVAPSGVENLTSIAMNIYPNPAANELNISTANLNSIATVEIYSLTGQMVQQSNIEAGSNTKMNISELNAGVYLVKITANGKTGISKLIKQ